MGLHIYQAKAALIISKYSLLAMLRSPTAIVFSILFPIIFITVFGSINPGKAPVMKLALATGSDTANMVFKAIKAVPSIDLKSGLSGNTITQELNKGSIDAALYITADKPVSQMPHYTVSVKISGHANEKSDVMKTQLDEAIKTIDQRIYPGKPSVATLLITRVKGREYRSIDFILPGQLGFSLLMAGVYGSSFLLFSLRKNLVLKRLRTAPVKRGGIIAGEMLSRLFFHIISFIIMVMLGYFVFNFTLVNGFATFMEMLIFSLFGLFIFMGIGFIISGVVQSENSIAPIANTIVLPQILLCGLFFPVENYPHWLQEFCNILPLTLFVDGLRKIAFEGTHLWQIPLTIGGLILWIFIIGPLSIKLFKWE